MSATDEHSLTPDPYAPDDEARFGIQTDADASKLGRWLTHVRRQRAANAATAEAMTDDVNAWHARIDAQDARTEKMLVDTLTEYGVQQRARGRKSVDLPFVVIATRSTGGGVVIADLEKFYEWAHAKERGDLVRVKEEPDKNAIKAWVKETGELPPGVALAPDGVAVDVSTPTGGSA